MGRAVKILMVECGCSVVSQIFWVDGNLDQRCGIWANELRGSKRCMRDSQNKGLPCIRSAIRDIALANHHMDKAFLCTPSVGSPVQQRNQ
jgi:hypothetical protein